MPHDMNAQLDAYALASEAIQSRMSAAVIEVVQPPRRRGPAPMPPRLVERGGYLYIRDAGYEETTYCTPDRRADAEIRLANYVQRKAARLKSMVAPRETRVADALGYLLEAEFPGPEATARQVAAYKGMATRLATLTAFFHAKTFGDLTKACCKAFVKWRTEQRDARYRPDAEDAPFTKAAAALPELSTLRKAVDVYADELGLPWRPTVWLPPQAPPRERFLIRDEIARICWATRGRIWDDEKGGWKTQAVVDETGRTVERRVLRPPETIAARKAVYRFLATGYYTGTRHTALLGLSWLISPSGGCIDVDAGMIHRLGFGKDPAVGKPQHSSEIAVKFASIARGWRDNDLAAGIERVVHQPDGSPYRSNIQWNWNATIADSGLGVDVVAHVMRHTATTHLKVAKQHAQDTGAALGMSMESVLRVYGHDAPRGQRDTADVLGYGRGIKDSVALNGARRKPASAPSRRDVDPRQLELPLDLPEDSAPGKAPVAPLAFPPTPLRCPSDAPRRRQPMDVRRARKRTVAKKGVSDRAGVGFGPYPRVPTAPGPAARP
jgi:integrase